MTTVSQDIQDAREEEAGTAAPAQADVVVAEEAAALPGPEPLAASFRAVPRIGHAGGVWAVPAHDGVVIGIDAQGFAKWWTGLTIDAPAALLRTEHLRVGGITAVAFGGRPAARVVALGTADGQVWQWRPASGAKPFEPPEKLGSRLPRAISALAVAPDGSAVAAATVGGEVRLRGGDGADRWTRDHDAGDRIADLAFAPDGTRVAGACVDGLVSVWDVSTGRRTAALPTDGPVLSVAFSPDGSVLASGSAMRSIQLWGGEPLGATVLRSGLPRAIERLAFGAGGVLYAADEAGEIQVLDAGTLEGPSLADASHFPCSTELPARCLRAREGRLRSLVVDESNGLLAGGEDGGIRWLAVAEGDRSATPPAEVLPLVAAPAPGGDEVAVGLTDGAIVRLDLASGRELGRATGHGDAVTALAWLPGGTLVSASLDGSLRTWRDAARADQVFSDHHRPVTALAASPDGTLVASGGADGAILLWNVVDGRLEFQGTLDGHVSRVLALAFEGDGGFLWSAGLDRAVERWNLARRRSSWRHAADVRPAPTRLWIVPGAGVVVGRGDGALVRVDARGGVAVLGPRCDGPVLGFAAAAGSGDGAFVWCGDGALRRAEGLAAEVVDGWAGEPEFREADAVAVFVRVGGGAVVAGESVAAFGSAAASSGVQGATPSWRTWFVPGGSLTIDAGGGWWVVGAASRAVWYSDGEVVRGVDDGAVKLRRGAPAARGER